MRKKTIGKLSFGPTVDITDPCYDKDVWCRMNTDILHMIWQNRFNLSLKQT